jgi:glutamine amidotransferase
MCRFIAYLGEPILLSSLVTDPDHSIIHQSYHSRERPEPLNGDGFGLAWYVPRLSETAALFKDTTPAWSNENLRQVARVVESDCIFAHVRAATGGSPVSRLNCHPFSFGPLTFMHNGLIPDFGRMRRRLLEGLSDETYNSITGSTDSEHIFALFCEYYQGGGLEGMAEALLRTIARLEELRAELQIDRCCFLNFALTDGHVLACTRYISDGSELANSLYYTEGEKYRCQNGVCQLEKGKRSSVVVASERLSLAAEWTRISPNQMLLADRNGLLELRAIPTAARSLASATAR